MAANTTCLSQGDYEFGPVVDPCVRKFDFTLLFEDAILSIVPSAVFVILAALRILSLRSQPNVAGNVFRLVKLVS